MIFDYNGIWQLVPLTISGCVVSGRTGLPVVGTHVYLRHGKE